MFWHMVKAYQYTTLLSEILVGMASKNCPAIRMVSELVWIQ